MKNVAVFFGGASLEHDVSVITGVLTANSLDHRLYNPVPIYVDNDGVWYTGELLDLDNYKKLNYKRLKKVTFVAGENVLYVVKGKSLKPYLTISVAINCMHGERGEDGSLAGLLNLQEIPLLSPNVTSSAISMDKGITKLALKGINVPSLDYVIIKSGLGLKNVKLPFEYPVIVKPISGGSSIGIKKAKDLSEFENAVNFSLRFGDRVIVEPCLEDFTEINCAGYRNSAGKIIVSECERPIGASEVLSFQDKYESGKREFPANISKKDSDKIKLYTEKVYRELGFSGTVRIDYFLKEGKIYLNEINSVPGSLAYYLFCDTLREFTDLLTDMIKRAEREHAVKSTLVRKYNSGILTLAGGKSAKKL